MAALLPRRAIIAVRTAGEIPSSFHLKNPREAGHFLNLGLSRYGKTFERALDGCY